MIQGIRHIIFDLGGVLLNLDFKGVEQAFVDLGVSDFPKRYSQLKQDSLFDDLETGKISASEFIAGIRKAAPDVPLSDEQIINAWNAILLDFPMRRLQLLQQLRTHYDLVLLSNTNEIHEIAFNKILEQTCGINSLAHFFDKVYYSHRVGMRKPGKEVFQRILEENAFLPEHTLFIDDSPQHIETAKSLGIQTIYLEKGMTIENDVFKQKPA
jgi:putative hydrolase of the HAD superfamily